LDNYYTYMPDDIDEDVDIFPLIKATHIIPFLITCVVAGILFFLFYAANAVVLGFIILFTIPILTGVILVFDVPGWITKWNRFRKIKGLNNIENFIEVPQVLVDGQDDPVLTFKNKLSIMCCEIKAGPWDYLTIGERNNTANSFRLALLEANREVIQVQIVLENVQDKQVIPQSLSHNEGTIDLISNRSQYWKESLQRFRTYYHVVFWGKDKQILKEVALEFAMQLENIGNSYTFYSSESILEWMKQQRDPFPYSQEPLDPKQLMERIKERFLNKRKLIETKPKVKVKNKIKKIFPKTTPSIPLKIPKIKISFKLSLPTIDLTHITKVIETKMLNINFNKDMSCQPINNALFKQVESFQTLVVWNPDGYKKGDTALELAQWFKSKCKQDVSLLELDVINPRIDILLDIPNPSINKCLNKSPEEIGAGLLTFGNRLDPDIAFQLLHKYKYGIDYLPAGNTMGFMDNSMMSISEYEELIIKVKECFGKVIIDCCTDISNPSTTAALRQCEAVVLPIYNLNRYTSEMVNMMENSGLTVIKYFPEKQNLLAV